ncbi:tRNA1(Val) (adenine(37)-N6)-methyltransferase [Mahella sp.]|uniref:tRNA1(Val) (adenine(37)-N6)-methyltransferase n=1 Tax=Mahella sp. TaxID=2798721 RepID=UPI0025BE3E32|nr:tRNA1(Val) (adenine(37)-N6)-methyltransferase [Mahella sp.]MBZ4665039.1 methylase [Mahella sp.]MDK2903029.1 tRNA1Val (adenine37-N6)-methyltransferase [Clostridiales bacterium]
MDVELKEEERLDDLQCGGLKIIQSPRLFSFGIDAVLLANFARIKPGDTVVDLGTGSGVIPLLLACKTAASKIYGLEIQREMADMARRSVMLNDLEGRVDIIEGDIRKADGILGISLADAVISNPPYRKAGSGHVSPSDARAIATYELKCTLDDVVNAASALLKNKGRFYMIHRPARLADAICGMRKAGIEPKRLRMVQPFADKKPVMFLIEGIKGAQPHMDIMPALIIYGAEGMYTDEIYGIYGMEVPEHGG